MPGLFTSLLALNTGDGYLPVWMAFISGIAAFNAVQNYLTTNLTKRVYSQTNQVNELSSRTFGIWTMTSALIRMYAAVDLHDPKMYDLALLSYYVAAFHFSTEVALYKTAKWGAISPIIVACTTTSLVRGSQNFLLICC
ncbi:Ergosterol biosynthetic protein [Taphrina deformans PYCC 5710]|uniref:Ergosterol biosynthetic protein n=1 Tax=Taphrina deformans (strain PYCC 5710 / ATCC 11124 / CBS 356.35 / IMI 108563 / JCM 9778 / NBRC 8474) TaxID=1097556 RepID=R4XFD5_TAPDE|nr:Ergosterol biosynthetic protein [Taphrina deformans PYCC 5710]|eukprot:CCG83161.1 Ergosterol biosynthetic protein [Taphrina deformans PYCC 5710]